MTNTTDKVVGITLTADNAKKFANRLKSTLKAENIEFKTSKCYDILAKTFGSSNWHELNQHLTSHNEVVPTVEKSIVGAKEFTPIPLNSTGIKKFELNSMFNLPWQEFKYLINNFCDSIQFDTLHKETIEHILELTHCNLKDSLLNWHKIEKILSPESNFIIFLTPGISFPDILFKDMFPDLSKTVAREAINHFSTIIIHKQKIETDKIFRFLKLLQFLNNNNTFLSVFNASFIPNDILGLTTDNRNNSFFAFINDIMSFSNYIKKGVVSFHDLIIILFSRTNLLEHHRDNDDARFIHKSRYIIAKELFENLNQYVENHFDMYLVKENNVKNFEINYILNYYPDMHTFTQIILNQIKLKNTFIYPVLLNITVNTNSPAIIHMDLQEESKLTPKKDLETSLKEYTDHIKDFPSINITRENLPVDIIEINKKETPNDSFSYSIKHCSVNTSK